MYIPLNTRLLKPIRQVLAQEPSVVFAYLYGSPHPNYQRESWFHISETHDDLAGYYDDVLYTIENPDLVVQGYGGALVAVKGMGRSRYLCVVYKEFSSKKDGFIITAYFTSKIDRRKALWPKKH
jgi:hypothetical protein